MPDPEISPAITDPPQAADMAPVDGDEKLKRTSHEVDSDDMFKPSAL